MNIIEKYEYFKKGLVTRGTSINMQKFFKTQPTPEQLLIISQMNRDDNVYWTTLFFIWLFFGVSIGFLLGMFYILMELGII